MTELPESAKNRALRILERRDVSRKELVRKLTEKGERSEDAEQVADWLCGLNVIDDARYAAMIVRHYSAKGYGKSRMQQELYRHGIEKELWEEALEQYAPGEEKIDALLRSKCRSDPPDRAELKKAADALLRRGFSWKEINAARDRVFGDHDDYEEIY